MILPVGDSLSTRATEPGDEECPSATRMLPSGATSTSFGCQKNALSRPPPGLPSVSSSLPSGLNLKIWCPFGRDALSVTDPATARVQAQSVTHTFPSRSTWMPCGDSISPAPNDAVSVPDL